MALVKHFCFALFLLLAGFIAGALFQRSVPVNDLLVGLGLRQPFHLPPSAVSPLRSPHTPNLANDAATFTGLVLGQSNAGSHGLAFSNESVVANTYQFWQGSLYPAHDPLYGTSGDGGSIWMQLSPQLLEDYQAVVWAPTAVGSTRIVDWIPGGSYHRFLVDTLAAIVAESLPVDALFWIQGERDAASAIPEDEYYQSLLELINVLRDSLPDTPIYLAKATRCYAVEPYLPIRNALDRVVTELDGVYAGIDLDKLGLAYRYDGCHLTQDGLAEAARQWHKVLETGLR